MALMAGLVVLCLPTPALAKPRAVLSEPVKDLGQVSEGKLSEYEFVLHNRGDEALSLEVVESTCDCVKVHNPETVVSVAPGVSHPIGFSFNSYGLEGEVKKSIYVYTNDPESPVLRQEVKAQVLRRRQEVVGRFRDFSPLAVIGAGLLDGVNPCAFTVMVFFVSFLTFIGYRSRGVLLVGTFFILGVFIAYFLLGWGLFGFLHKLEGFRSASRLLTYSIAGLAGVLGFLSLWDALIYSRTHDSARMNLRLPGAVKTRIQMFITQGSLRQKDKGMAVLAGCAFITGIAVSLFESVCTGQVYLPTIVYVLREPALRIRALWYLFIYNLCFILPLGGVFLLSVKGIGSNIFARLAQRHLVLVKVLTACLFFFLARVIYMGRYH